METDYPKEQAGSKGWRDGRRDGRMGGMGGGMEGWEEGWRARGERQRYNLIAFLYFEEHTWSSAGQFEPQHLL